MIAFIDRCYQLAYIVAYRLVRLTWAVRRPKTFGALIAVWHQGKILLVKNSYVEYYSLPGGYIKRGEKAVDAAVRELREEIGIRVGRDELDLVLKQSLDWEFRKDNVTVFSLELTEAPVITVDNREVVAAGFYTPDEALNLKLFPPIVNCIEQHRARTLAERARF